MRADRRDNNEAEYLELWKGLGYVWVAMKPGQGFDGLLVTPTGIHIVEIKNGNYKWKLTDCERKVKEQVEHMGQEYHIIDCLEDAKYLAGAI